MSTPLKVQPSPKLPPHSNEAEQSVLGGLLLDNRAWNELADRLVPEDFYRRDHQLIYQAICELVGAAKPCDFVTLSEHLRAQGRLEDAGGLSYVGALANDTPSAANVLAYAEIVRERSVLRSLIASGGDIAELGYRPEGRNHSELIDLAEQKVFAIRNRTEHATTSYLSMSTLMDRVEAHIELLRTNKGALPGLGTGFTELDKLTTGLHEGDLAILAGRPSMGKCLSADAELVLDDGSVVTIEELFRRRDARVGTLRDDLRIDRALPSDYVDDGEKPVFEVTTRLGRQVETTLPHPFLTLDGWKPLAELRAGDYVAVPRVLPVFGDQSMRECEVKLIAYLIGDGGLTGSSPRFTTTHPRIERDFVAAVAEFGGCVCTPYRSGSRAPSFAIVADAGQVTARRTALAATIETALARSELPARAVAQAVGVSPASIVHWRRGKTVPDPDRSRRLCRVLEIEADELLAQQARHNAPNAVSRWLQQLGLDGKGAATKTIPAAVQRLPRPQLALFLRHLFATDGWATVYASGQAQIGYSTVSDTLARQVSHLLLRFGIIAKLRQRWVRYKDARRPSWQLDISDAPSLRRFVDEIGIFAKEEAVARVDAALRARRVQTNTDLIPVAVWHRIERAKGAMSWAELSRRAGIEGSNIHARRRALSRSRLARLAMVLNDAGLAALAGSDVYWDRIESIVPRGMKQVYDLTIPHTHNFIANDVCVHNTSLALNIAEHCVLYEKKAAAVFSMEMPADQIALRVLSSFSRINMKKLRSGELEDRDWDRLVSQGTLVREAPLYVDETGALSPLELRARARRLKARHDIQLIVVDYIQLMQVPGAENRTNEVSEISRNLKSLAKELRLPIIALSQLNRGVENRENKRPRMADLRESGGIEQDADLVMFIYRDEVYNPESPDKGTAEIIIAKQRNGPLGTVKAAFLGEYTRFENLAQGYEAGY